MLYKEFVNLNFGSFFCFYDHLRSLYYHLVESLSNCFVFTIALQLHRTNNDPTFPETSLPYYGALSKQFFPAHGPRNIAESNINILNVANTLRQQHQQQAQRERTVPSTPTRVNTKSSDNNDVDFLAASVSFEEDFNKIQLAAARLVAIQEVAKRKGAFSSEDNQVYANSLLELGQAAQNLAMLQQTGQIKDFSILLQPTTFMPQKQPSAGVGAASAGVGAAATAAVETVDQKIEEQKVDEVTELQLSESELFPPNPEDPYEDVNDSVAISAPKKDASVAEAKPVGLSIAGEGGVASSKPNAVALSGRNGLAVASPKATAIAGVTAEEAAAFSISLPNRNQLVIKSNSRLANSDYDEDYNDLVMVPAVRTLTQAANDKTSKNNNNNYQRVVYTRPQVERSASGKTKSFVEQWKTAIADDFAAPQGGVPQVVAYATRNANAEPQFYYRFI